MSTYHRFVPRPMTDRAYWTALADQPVYADLLAAVSATVDLAQPAPPHLLATDFLAARRHNNRRVNDAYWQLATPTVSVLAINRALRGIDPADPDDRLLNWLWTLVTTATWERSAHIPGNDLPPAGRAQLDLGGCDVAASLAEIAEVLAPWMDSISANLKDRVLDEIDRRVIAPFAAGEYVWWGDLNHPNGANNWMGVCAGDILAICESFAALGRPNPAARERAKALLRTFFDRGFTPDGECDEGVGYWSYGVGVACLGLSRLAQAELEATLDMDRFRQVASYPQRAHLGRASFYAGNDAGPRTHGNRGYVPWLARASGVAWLDAWTAAHPPRRHVDRFGVLLRALALPDDFDPTVPTPPASARPRLLADQQAGIFPLDGGVAVLSGGHNAERHNHNDLGHFSVFVDGSEVIADLGAPQYTADFFGPNRYRHLAASSRGHCCPVINDHEQRPGKDASADVVHWRPEQASLKLDLTRAYPTTAGLKRWTREMTAGGRSIRVTDEFHTTGPQDRITHVLWSSHPAHADNGRLQIGPLTAELTPKPATLTIVPVHPSEHGLKAWTTPLYRIEAMYLAKSPEPVTIVTHLTLGG